MLIFYSWCIMKQTLTEDRCDMIVFAILFSSEFSPFPALFGLVQFFACLLFRSRIMQFFKCKWVEFFVFLFGRKRKLPRICYATFSRASRLEEPFLRLIEIASRQ